MITPLAARRGLITPLARGIQRESAAVSWWLSGGISAANCIAAYQPKGAASYAASKVNLANPGTYDAGDGSAYPTWNATDGWIFVTKYLTTGIVPTDNFSCVVRFSNTVNNGECFMLSSLKTGAPVCYFELSPYLSGNMRFLYGDKVLPVSSGGKSAGVMGMTNTTGYYNGASVVSMAGYSWSGTTVPLYIGRRNADGGGGAGFTGYIQALAIYNINIDSYVSALTIAMNAL